MKNTVYFVLTALGGLAVLGSYAYGLATHPGQGSQLWGTLPEGVHGVYTASMFPAAVGYLIPWVYFLKSPWQELRLASGPIFGQLLMLNAMFLVTASLWMPLSWAAVDGANQGLFWPIQGVLAVTGVSAIGFYVVLRRLVDPPSPRLHRAATLCSLLLVWQCAVLDALVWPRFFVIG